MFSTRMTAESTMMPKSTAPTDSRLALSPRSTNRMIGEEQGERDVDADEDRAAQIAEEDPLDQEDQQAPEDQVVEHRVRGDARSATTDRSTERASRPGAGSVAVHLRDGRFDLGNHVGGLLGAAHDDDRSDDMSSSWSRPKMPSRGR